MVKLSDSIADMLARTLADAPSQRRIRAVEPRPTTLPFISVDDHLCEPPDTFVDRMPSAFAARTPRMITDTDGFAYWVFDDSRIGLSGADVQAGWHVADWYNGPIPLADARPGTWDIHARVADMDINGMMASMCFPSMMFGFAGQLFMRLPDREFGLACMRAYNVWILEGWAGPYPDRIIPLQVTWLPDPEIAAAEIRRNAARGFRAVAFSENPAKLGLPALTDKQWDPFFEACSDTGTAINIHTGSSSEVLPGGLAINGMVAVMDWLTKARVPLRFPDIRIVSAEGGIGWVPMVIDQLVYRARYEREADPAGAWPSTAPSAEDVLRRNFWFTSYFDPSALSLRHEIGIDKIMFEADYPHGSSSWPDSQEFLAGQMASFPQDDIDRLTWRNAADLYGLTVTPEVLPGRATRV